MTCPAVLDWVCEPLSQQFMITALGGAVLAVITTSLTGTWMVLRGMTFMGDALVHGVIPGVALAVLFEFNPVLGAAGAALVMIAGINLIHRQTAFSEDTGIGLLFVGMLALGVILISRTDSYTGSLTSILFGDVLAVTTGDLVWLGVVAAIVVGASLVLYRPFLALSFNEQKAELLGQRPRLAHFSMLALITLAIVGSFQTVGALLVFGLLIAPPATAALLVRRVPAMMTASVLIGIVTVAGGLLVSYHADTSGSATMALAPVAVFFAVLTARSLRGARA